ncbi:MULTISPECIES: MerR family DNA-binding transcriptional regulator [unclassified Kitasatospora]|uniref:MerR family DNA-binding transcriptional regulator n=1 Tax=unclassified Kitasatospora TaxID=2633591 RepID=UPI0024753ADA|nr:MerR family DNA-binding transcriptional regulator [Kitasatospora sp. MAP12-44]
MPIGDFSRATHLTVKMLRHYHELGLLKPVEVDVDNTPWRSTDRFASTTSSVPPIPRMGRCGRPRSDGRSSKPGPGLGQLRHTSSGPARLVL